MECIVRIVIWFLLIVNIIFGIVGIIINLSDHDFVSAIFPIFYVLLCSIGVFGMIVC